MSYKVLIVVMNSLNGRSKNDCLALTSCNGEGSLIVLFSTSSCHFPNRIHWKCSFAEDCVVKVFVFSFYSREKRSIANGLSPGMEEQSEYFDATENPILKDKRHELDDEDSGVDNASQILRESSVRFFLSTLSVSKACFTLKVLIERNWTHLLFQI